MKRMFRQFLVLAAGGLIATQALAALGLRVLSSPAQYVSGGDARIEISAPAAQHADVQLRLNGALVSVPLVASGDTLQGVVTGLVNGRNRLEARLAAERRTLVLTNHPITGPMFSGPKQMPFVCTTIQGAVGRQPLVDSASPPGPT